MAATFDPYHKWLGIPPAEQPPNHYRLLAINPFEGDPDVIEAAADQRMAHLRSLQTGQHAELTQKLLNKISLAKVCLLRPDQKKEYDRQLRAKLAQASAPPGAATPTHAQTASPASDSPALPVAGPLDFINADPARTAKSNVWEPEPLPLSGRGASKHGSSSYSSRKAKKNSPNSTIFGIVAGVVVVGIALAVYFASSQGGNTTEQTNSGSVALSQKSSDQSLINQPKPVPHALAPPPKNTSQPTIDRPSTFNPPANGNPPPDQNTNTTPDKSTQPPENSSPPDNSSSTPKNSPPTTPKPAVPAVETRKPVPEGPAQAKALAQVRDVLKDDYTKALTPAARSALVGKLIKLASETNDDATERFVMDTQAMDLAIKAGDVDLTFQAIDGLDSYFAVDAWELKARALIQLARQAKTPEARQAVASHALSMTDSALAADHYDAAVEMATVASTMADAIGEPVERDQAHEVRARAQRLQNVAQTYKAAKEKLAAHPDDAEANLTVGRFLCFQKDDWQAGLPYLARGGDPTLKKLAAMEAAAPIAPPDSTAAAAAREKLAEAWWDAAEKMGDRKNPIVQSMFARAKHWYQEAMPGLSGLALEKAQKRVSDEGETAAGKAVYLDDLPEHDVSADILAKHGATGLPADQPQDVIVHGVAIKHSLFMHSTSNGSAKASFTIDRKFGVFTAAVGFRDTAMPTTPVTFELRGDGQLLWVSRPIEHAGESQECRIPVENVKTLQLIVNCPGPDAYSWTVWVNPLLKK